MASLFTDRAVAYRARNDVSHSAVAMAVVVQEMVDADAAGVLFTADPDSGNRTVAAVDASFGLGEAVVASEVSPDHARIKKYWRGPRLHGRREGDRHPAGPRRHDRHRTG